MAASTRMCAKHRDEKRDKWRRLRRIRELDEESNQLAREQAIYESTKSKRNTDSEQVRESPCYDSKDSLGRDHAMRRREHYREWLGSQNIIHSIRNAEIEESGMTDIPPRNKRPGYSGYPSTAESHVKNCHATAGPSHPRTGTTAKDPRSTQNQTSNSHRTKTDSIPWPSPRNSHHQDNPGDLANGSSSDETYLPSSTRYSNTESDVTDSESRNQSSGTMPHRHLNDEHRSRSSNRRNHHSDADHSSNDYGRERNSRSHQDRHRNDDYRSSRRQIKSPIRDPETIIPLYTEE